MFSPKDHLYKETKMIKLGKLKLKREYDKFIRWAKDEVGITILNISYRKIRVGKIETRPGLQFILELSRDYNLVVNPQTRREKGEYQLLFSSKFAEIVRENHIAGYEGDNLNQAIISYAVFSKVAITESIEKITRSSLNQIKEKFAINKLWEIMPNGDQVILFYKKNSDFLTNKENGINRQIEEVIMGLVSKNDEFGYVNRASVSILYDSKENFERHFDGKWHYYFR